MTQVFEGGEWFCRVEKSDVSRKQLICPYLIHNLFERRAVTRLIYSYAHI